MKFFQKIALSLLDKEIEELLVRLRPPREGMMHIFRNTELSDNLSSTTNRFRDNVFLLVQTNSESDAALSESLSQLFSQFQSEMDEARSRHEARPVDYITKLRQLCDTISNECRVGFVRDTEFNDGDPLCIFQYNMISYIISTLMARTIDADNRSDRNIQLIRQEFERIQVLYPALVNEAAKLDFIRDCLEGIAREESEINQRITARTTLPIIGFMGMFGGIPHLTENRSSLQRVISSTLRELGPDVAPHAHHRVPLAPPVLNIPLPVPQAPVFFSPAIDPAPIQPPPQLTCQERYDALESNEALEALGYKQAALNEAWLCSINNVITDDPVSSGSSYKGVYEREAITEWIIRSSHNKATISAPDPITRELITLEQIVALPDVKDQINQFLSEQEAIKKYFEQCLERGFESQNESMAIVPYR